MPEESATATAEPNAPLETEEEAHQKKLDKAAQSGDPGSDIQPNAKAAADQLAAMVAPTPAIPARPETSTPPVNVAQRQRANLQPLPTDEELQELEMEAGPIVELAKRFFFIADEAGEPTVDTGTNSVFLHYPDGSQISVRFEMRPGEFRSIGPAAVTEKDAQARNKRFSDAKKQRDEAREKAKEAGKAQAEERERMFPRGSAAMTPSGEARLAPESHEQPQNQPEG